jgi:glycerate kinase
MVFMNAKLVSGIETVIARSGLRAELESADWIITGEGCFDSQSLSGKVVSGILKTAAKTKTRVAVLAGQVKVPLEVYKKAGILTAISCKSDIMSPDEALKNSSALLRSSAKIFAGKYLFR